MIKKEYTFLFFLLITLSIFLQSLVFSSFTPQHIHHKVEISTHNKNTAHKKLASHFSLFHHQVEFEELEDDEIDKTELRIIKPVQYLRSNKIKTFHPLQTFIEKYSFKIFRPPILIS